jgi:hypothetical protein
MRHRVHGMMGRRLDDLEEPSALVTRVRRLPPGEAASIMLRAGCSAAQAAPVSHEAVEIAGCGLSRRGDPDSPQREGARPGLVAITRGVLGWVPTVNGL